MHRKTATTLAALIGLSFATGLQATIDPTSVSIIPDNNALEHEHVSDRVFVRFKDPDALDSRIAVMDGIGGRIASSSKLVPGLHCIEIDVSVEEALRFLSQQGNTILYAEPVYIVRTMDTVPNDPFYNNLYGMPQINAPQAWDDHQGDQEFRVAIIDTGIDYNHPDLAANMWVNPGEIAGNGQDDDGNGYVEDARGELYVCDLGGEVFRIIPGTPPAPTGVCCWNENCYLVTESSCSNVGGEYKGDYTACSSFDCTAQPGLSAVFMQLLGFEGVSFRAKDATQLGLCGMKARLEIHAMQNWEN